jgi:hypothetical protein
MEAVVNRSGSILVKGDLKGGSSFIFIASKDEGRFLISFELNGDWSPESAGLQPGERVEATKLLLSIWERFRKYPCSCVPFSDYHAKVYSKMGFRQDPFDCDSWIYNP